MISEAIKIHPLEIVTEILILALDLKNENNNVMISGLVPRRDKLNDKGIEVNKYLYLYVQKTILILLTIPI